MGGRLQSLGVLELLRLPLNLGPVEWAEENMDMAHDKTAPTSTLIKLEPYQKLPIQAQFMPGVSEAVVMAPPQTGKSISWRVPVIYRIAQGNTGPGWIMYESDDKGKAIDSEQILPFVLGMPQLRHRLRDDQHAIRAGSYKLADGVLEFSGAGTPPTSKPVKFAVADELPTWPGTNETKLKTLGNFRDRLRRYKQHADSCLVIVGSPQGQDDPVGDLFADSTREHWYLKCLGCKKLTIASHDINALQFRVNKQGHPIEKSIRLICPACSHEHRERQAQRMNDAGGYVARARHPFRRGFHWGALASPSSYTWMEIAMRRLAANSKAPLSVLVDYAKSILGMPFKPAALTRDREEVLETRQAPPPDPEDLAILLFSADTQDTGFYWIVRAILVNGAKHTLAHGFADDWQALAAAWDAEYCGHRCAMGIIDEGGHRGKDVQAFVLENRGLYTWKGNSRTGARYKLGELDKERGITERLRMNGNPYTYQAALLFDLYGRKLAGDERHQPHHLYLPENAGQEYLEHLGAYRPNNKVRNGHRFENWKADQRPDHYFDAEKQATALLEHVENLQLAGDLPPAVWINPPRWLAAPEQQQPRKPQGEYLG